MSGTFDVLSTNSDRQGVDFVSSIEAKDFPIYGTQWHPEKNAYEWAKNVDTGIYIVNTFIFRHMSSALMNIVLHNIHPCDKPDNSNDLDNAG